MMKLFCWTRLLRLTGQHDRVVLGQPVDEIERVDVLFQPGDHLLADISAKPEFEIDRSVVGGKIRIGLQVEGKALEQGVYARTADRHAGLLIDLVGIHQLAHGKHRHHHLLRQGQPRRVIERHVPAIGDKPVDHLQLARFERDRDVSLVERFQFLGWKLLEAVVENILLIDGDHAEPPTRASEIFRVGIDTDRVVRQFRHQRAKVWNERAINIVRKENEIRPPSVSVMA